MLPTHDSVRPCQHRASIPKSYGTAPFVSFKRPVRRSRSCRSPTRGPGSAPRSAWTGHVARPVKETDIDAGKRPGTTTADAEPIRELERENRELKRTSEILLGDSSFLECHNVGGVGDA